MPATRIASLAALALVLLISIPARAADEKTAAQKPVPTKPAYGIALNPDGGSGPDKTRFRIVSEKQAEQQRQAREASASVPR